ncbi:MAG: Eco57I restriction-modification methylase domain-containing protein [Corynebacterium sp.]|uniref:Eco57I restriction-modification methylase domain-containing protein n=1 Tax=Corynebacterium sp. TaxID=1720 RepID=UPI0026DDC24D|nr:N-6 DNA methylase [Corynebacterium sp.]MDO5098612.1 Eco57I restriction-modification methylase domain-containing protein [Corynebacterium sp.]
MVSAEVLTKTGYGEIFTRRWVVETMLDLIGYTPDRDLARTQLIEPSIGSGAFIIPVIERLLVSAALHGATPEELRNSVFGMDLQPTHVATCRSKVNTMLLEHGFNECDAELLAMSWLREGDFLLDEVPSDADFVIGNPPYIRTEDLDDEVEKAYRARWATMRGRADIYVGFYERGLSVLRPDGRLSYICADRWMHNSYGKALRGLISTRYAVETVWQMHDVDAFETEVSAYPAITVIARRTQCKATFIATTEIFNEGSAREVLAFTRGHEEIQSGNGWEGVRCPNWFETDDFWPAGSPSTIKLLEHLQEHFPTLESDGTTRISIGVATGNDRAYLVDMNTTEDVEPDRLLPLVMADDIREGFLNPPSKQLLNPWDERGDLIHLSDYPRFAHALERRPLIRERYVAKKNPGKWHRTIDKVYPGVADRPKLLFQDMKAKITPVYEPGGLYPHHNLYYIVSDTWDLEVLGGLLLSSIAEAFVTAYGVKMRGGTLRFQAQYLRKIAVPQPSELTEDVSERLRAAFRARDRVSANFAAEDAYGLPRGTIERYL